MGRFWSWAVMGLILVVMPICVPRVVRAQDAPAEAPAVIVTRVEASGGEEIKVSGPEGGLGAGGIVVRSYGPDGGLNVMALPGTGTFSMPLPLMSAGDDPVGLLNMAQIQQELELIEPQLEQLRKVQANAQKRQSDLMRRMAEDGVRQPDVMAAIQDEIKELRAQTRAEVEKLLLPHQAERWQQVARQVRLQRRGTANGLMGDELATELGLTEDQKAKLRDRAKEIEEELQQEIARLRKKAEEKILGELTPAQKEKLQTLLGKQIEIKPPQFRTGLPVQTVPAVTSPAPQRN